MAGSRETGIAAAIVACALPSPAVGAEHAVAAPDTADRGEVSASLTALWLERSTADGHDLETGFSLRARIRGVTLASLPVGTISMGPGARWLTTGADSGSGTVAVATRHHLLAAGVGLWLDHPAVLPRLFVEALADVATTSIRVEGAGSRDESGMRGGLIYGAGVAARAGAFTFGGEIAGARRGPKNDLLLAFTAGWTWGAVQSRHGSLACATPRR